MMAFKAELSKMATLPATWVSLVVGTAVAAILGVAVASGSAQQVVISLLRYLQCVAVVLGVLGSGQEYAGHQITATLCAMPRRGVLFCGKCVAVFATVAVGAASLLAGAALGSLAAGAYPGGPWPKWVAMWAYLLLMGMLGHAVSSLLRNASAALAAVLITVIVCSPLLAAMTPHARWLPDRAAAQLLMRDDAVLDGVGGALVAVGWVAVITTAAAFRFVR